MRVRSSFRATCLLCVAIAAAFLPGCSEFADEDSDGWFTKTNNLATVLTLTTASFNNTSQSRYRIIIDDVRFPSAAVDSLGDLDPNSWLAVAAIDTATLNTPVAKRVQGMNAYTGSGVGKSTYSSRVRVEELTGSVLRELGAATVAYTSDGNESPSVTVGGGGLPTVTLSFTTATTRFADPNPNDPAGDSDLDGITEAEEAQLMSSFAGIGDPRPGMLDLVLVVGFTEPRWNIDPITVDLLTTRFFTRAINLHVDNGTLNGRPGIGGMMTLGGVPVVPNTVISVAQAASIRNSNLPAGRRRFTRFALMAAGVSTGEFGRAAGIPGNHLVMRAQLELLGPNFHNYQTGVLMHEFGHLLGLCHPTLQTGTAGCASIPVAERDPGATVMGAPSEDLTIGVLGVPQLIAHALERPMDYSATQWTLVTLGGGLAP